MFVFRRTHVCVFRVRIYMCVCSRVHICVFTCTHVCVPIRHTVVFQENTCLLSDEHSCVSVFSARAEMCVFTCAVHMCVLHVCTCVCVHVCAFASATCTHMCVHVYTRVFQWTRVCVPGEHMFVFR